MSASVGKLVPLFMVILFLMIGSVYASNILSSESQSVNITDSTFNTSYQNIQEQQNLFNWSMFPVSMVLLIIFVVAVMRQVTR
jgi:hypothetical protein